MHCRLGWKKKLTWHCHYLLASVQLINLYPPSRNQTVHQPLWLSCRLVDKTIHCERREVKSFEFHESLVFFIFFLLDILSTLVS
uniref:Uncharacterized protein n=1 Tax=Populus trichocarpa TaxID=3694 RepID=A0A2K2AYA2_POPTR